MRYKDTAILASLATRVVNIFGAGRSRKITSLHRYRPANRYPAALHSMPEARGRRLRPQFLQSAAHSPGTFVEGLRLGHLECDVATTAHDLRADLDQLVLQTCQ